MRVEINNVGKLFGSVKALDNVSLEVHTGELFFLLGPSGSGKTTLLRILAGFEEASSGRVLFDEQDVTKIAPEKRGTALVFQNYALWPHLTVEQNIAFGLEVLKVSADERKKRIAEVLEQVRMKGYEKRRPAELSGGQQQRVALARALVVRPQLVLLDEPLSNLDAKLRLEMRVEIRQIIKELGHTAVYVTHDQKEALSMADRCAILNEGRVEQVGDPRTLYEKPNSEFVAGFLGEINVFPAKILEREPSGRYALQLNDSEIRWTGLSESDLAEGASVLCLVRPEAWRIGESHDGIANALEGQLHSSMYLGEVSQHIVDSSAERTGRVKILEVHRPSALEGRVSFWTDPESTILLPMEKV